MRELTADLFATLDGYAGGVDAGPFFGYGGPELAAWIETELARPQILVMGRVTYQALAPLSLAADDEGAARMTALPKLVASRTLAEPLGWPNTRVLAGDAADAVATLKRRQGDPLRTIGSLSLVASLLRAGLVDRLRVAVFPLLLGGDGREPAFAAHQRCGLELVATTVLDSRVVILEYRPAAEPQRVG